MQTEAIPADLPDLKLINNAKGVEGGGSRFKIFHVMLVCAQLHKGELPAEYPDAAPAHCSISALYLSRAAANELDTQLQTAAAAALVCATPQRQRWL